MWGEIELIPVFWPIDAVNLDRNVRNARVGLMGDGDGWERELNFGWFMVDG